MTSFGRGRGRLLAGLAFGFIAFGSVLLATALVETIGGGTFLAVVLGLWVAELLNHVLERLKRSTEPVSPAATGGPR
ncbi:hypothetical protein [Halomarina oriensis]|uniref:Uncharacterized protein n=1 Tax=Halomarina oriensis TaxID=671145 RepID=A0A6B0GR82_9EURY|nr:hypothetical protein [Halomarina oriensis]MWG35887.1 hypothetical protein [Halomarina oriensis]